MNIAICDDEQQQREQIKSYIQLCNRKQIDINIDLFSSGEKLISTYRNGKIYDIIFLDIIMKKVNGIETAHIIHSINPYAIIVFISNYVTYVSETFRQNAFQFLIKPIHKDIFKKEFRRILDQYYAQHRKYLIQAKSSRIALDYKEIVYIEGYQRHLFVVTKSGAKYTDVGKLDDKERQMKLLGFIRIHQGFLLNMDYIKSINSNDILTSNGMLIPMSKRKKMYVINQFNKYIMGKIL